MYYHFSKTPLETFTHKISRSLLCMFLFWVLSSFFYNSIECFKLLTRICVSTFQEITERMKLVVVQNKQNNLEDSNQRKDGIENPRHVVTFIKGFVLHHQSTNCCLQMHMSLINLRVWNEQKDKYISQKQMLSMHRCKNTAN